MKIKITHLESPFINDKSILSCLFDLKLDTKFDSTTQRLLGKIIFSKVEIFCNKMLV